MIFRAYTVPPSKSCHEIWQLMLETFSAAGEFQGFYAMEVFIGTLIYPLAEGRSQASMLTSL